MNKIIRGFICLGATALCGTQISCTVGNEVPVIPYPAEVSLSRGAFDASGSLWWMSADADSLSREAVRRVLGGPGEAGLDDCMETADRSEASVAFVVDAAVPYENYVMDTRRTGITVRASELHGFIYAVQTLRQLMPQVPCGRICDAPRFPYRGMHLDVSRHFFSVDQVKKYIDMLELHKMNRFHWHLTDDQGWRIEMKKYPLLTKSGDFYTRNEIRDIVAYAQARGIEVIPEVDMPGHMLGALAVYPSLGCTGGPYEVWNGRWGISDDVLCAGKETVYDFVSGVLEETAGLFPSEYLHVGGDECPKVRWEACPDCRRKMEELGIRDDDRFTAGQYMQSHFMNRVASIAASMDRRIIGWDEILEGTVPKDVTVMSWRGAEGGVEAAKAGHDVIMTPSRHMYFDYRQGTGPGEPGANRYLPISEVYAFEPVPKELDCDAASHIIGVQANLWTEHVPDADCLEYMLLPRIDALSEVQWCSRENRDYVRFYRNLENMLRIYESLGLNYCPHVRGVSASVSKTGHGFEVVLSTCGRLPIYYTVDGTEPFAFDGMGYVPSETAALYSSPVSVMKGCVLTASVMREGGPQSSEIVFNGHKAFGKDVILNEPPHPAYSLNAVNGLTDGIHGEPHTVASGKWFGWQAPVDVTVDMDGGNETYSKVILSFYVDKRGSYFAPSGMEVLISDDGHEFVRVASASYEVEGEDVPDGVKQFTLEFPQTCAPYLRIVCTNPVLPEWHPAKGFMSFMLIDEIIVL